MNKKKDVLKTKQQSSYGYPSPCIGASMYRCMGVWVPPYLGIFMSWRMKYMRPIYSWICSWIYPWVCKRCKIHGELFFSLLSWGMFLFLTMGWSFFVSAQDTECRELLSIQGAQDGSVMEATETVEVDKTIETIETPETVGVVEMDRTLEIVKTVESVKAGEKDKLKDDTERFLSYLGRLLEENILQDRHLFSMQEGLKKGKIENPFSETEASREMKTYVHWEGLAEHLEGALDSTRIGDWVEVILSQKALEREQRKVVRETTKEVPELIQKFKITNSNISSSIKLKNGRIWVGSEDGRVWMFHPDGSVYKDFQLKSGIVSFLELEDGRVWVISRNGHVSIRHSDGSLDRDFYIDGWYNNKRFAERHGWIEFVFKLKDGRFLVDTSHGNVFIYDADGSVYREFEFPDYIEDLLELPDGRIFLLQNWNYVSTLNPDGSLYDDFQSDQILIDFFLKLQDGRFWIAKTDRVFMYDSDGNASGNFKFKPNIDFYLELSDGKIWLYSLDDHNMYIYNPDGSFFGDFQVNSHAPSLSIPSFLELKDGRVLVDLGYGYMSIRHADGSAAGDFQFSKMDTEVLFLFELEDGRLWVNTRGGYIHILDLDVAIDLFRTEVK